MDAKELDWVHHHLREEKQDPGAKEGGGGYLRGMIDTIIGNLQLSITNVHIRYEVRRAHVHACKHPLAACMLGSWP